MEQEVITVDLGAGDITVRWFRGGREEGPGEPLRFECSVWMGSQLEKEWSARQENLGKRKKGGGVPKTSRGERAKRRTKRRPSGRL